MSYKNDLFKLIGQFENTDLYENKENARKESYKFYQDKIGDTSVVIGFGYDLRYRSVEDSLADLTACGLIDENVFFAG